MKKPKKFTIPDSFIAQLQEFTKGGFILCYIDENDEFRVVFNPSNSVAAYALPRMSEIACVQIQKTMMDQAMEDDDD